ncbi:diguanylate cyclase [Alteromonas sp. MMG017]|uniref:diguanylate cyclase n=1 Tax=Alteromonas sp. MMG017 TaxID=2822692 RepID=UPI001B3A61BB|nr:diguanylate cyclase [Alteromonas sp. MMG017]MBQ4831004.1 diguanylate cyclase [Alteromonas sp. MMG017]
MQTLQTQELMPVIEKVENAIVSHRLWVRNLMRALVCHDSYSENDLLDNAHELCSFGRWYFGEQPNELRESKVFREIEVKHKCMHQSAALMLKNEKNNKPISNEAFDAFYIDLDNFLNTLDKLKQEINTLLYNRDPLTGAFNRRSLDEELFEINQLISSESKSACIVLLDLDHFKSINDNYGHNMGDQVLKQTTEVILGSLRSIDKLFRYGGEEFVISLVPTTIDSASMIAERMRAEIAAMQVVCEDEMIQVTASFGIAQVSASADASMTLAKADKALYKAKQSGRNQVVIFEEKI